MDDFVSGGLALPEPYGKYVRGEAKLHFPPHQRRK